MRITRDVATRFAVAGGFPDSRGHLEAEKELVFGLKNLLDKKEFDRLVVIPEGDLARATLNLMLSEDASDRYEVIAELFEMMGLAPPDVEECNDELADSAFQEIQRLNKP